MEDGKAKGQGVYEIIVAKGEQSCRTCIISVLKNLNIKNGGYIAKGENIYVQSSERM